MSCIIKKIKRIRDKNKLIDFEDSDLWKTSRCSLGAELDLIIFLAEIPNYYAEPDWEKQPISREFL